MKDHQTTHAERSNDIAAIERIVADAERFQNDPEAFTRLLTEDVILINFTGIRLIGRDEVYSRMKQAVASSLAKILTKQNVEHIKFLNSNVAVMTGIKSIITEAEELDFVSEGEQARLTFVLIKEGDEWFISFIQNTPIRNL